MNRKTTVYEKEEQLLSSLRTAWKEEWAYENREADGAEIVGEEFDTLSVNRCRFSHCTFSDCNFSHTSFTDVTFCGCDLSNSDFSDAYFSNCGFENCKLLGTRFNDSEQSGAAVLCATRFCPLAA